MTRSGAELDQHARELLAQIDAEYAPTRADRERVHARVLQSLAGVPVSVPGVGHEKLEQIGDAPRDGATGWSFALGAKAIVSAVAIGSVCFGAGFFAGRQTAPVAMSPASPAPAVVATSVPLSSALSLEPEGQTPDESPRVARRASRSAQPPSRPTTVEEPAAASPDPKGDGTPDSLEIHTSALWQETQLLQRAQRAFGSGNAQLSRALLDELSDQFPKGALIEERAALRILTECALGRIAEARAQAQSFEAAYPSSVHSERVRTSCAAGAAGELIQ